MSDQMRNGLLQQAESKVASGLGSETAESYEKIVTAGMSAAIDKGPNSILASLKNSKDPISDAAKGAVALVMILRKEANGVMPEKALVPAAMALMLKALDFVDRAGIAKVGQPELVKATHIFTDTIFAAFGISKEGLQRVATKVDGFTKDPEAMAKINVRAGVARHPDAPNPASLLNGAPGAGEVR